MDLQKENKMGTMPVGRLLISMSLPMIVSMLVQALYNVVDSYFVGMVSLEALTAVGQAFSAQNLMIGIATGTGVGVNALLSKSLGEKDPVRANRIAENGVLLALVGYVVILVFGLFGCNLYFDGILSSAELDAGLDLAAVKESGIAYLRICTILSLFVFIEIMFERLMQSTGKTIYTMYTQGVGAIFNIVFDPIFILDELPFGLRGLGLGAAGAAWATVLGQAVACGLAILLNRKFNTEIRLQVRKFRPDLSIIKSIYAIGVPSIIMVAVGSVMYYAMNIILMGVSAFGASIFGVYFKLQSFVFMPLFGMNNGVIPIIAYNYGAGNRRRMMKTVKLAACVALGFMLLGLLLMQFVPDVLLSLFIKEAAVVDLGCTALRIISTSFLFAGVCIVLGSVFQALGRGSYSMLVSIARQLLVLVPVAYLLAQSGDLNRIWWSYPIAELASLTVTLLLFARIYRQIIAGIPEGAA